MGSEKKRNIVRAGRRGGKTTGAATRSVKRFLARRRQLYVAPTQEQVDAFWWETKRALNPLIDAGVLYKNESLRLIEFPRTQVRIRAKSAWNADTLRGDYADDLTIDEWQLCNEDMWDQVGAPMLLDNDGDAVFIYTPPSLRSRSISKARDPLHASKMFKRAEADETGRWAAFHFSSHANPHISADALSELTLDMTSLAIRQEIMAEDTTEIQGALWKLAMIEPYRVLERPTGIVRIVVGVDPPGGVAECGIVVVAKTQDGHYYVLDDRSLVGTPERWGSAVVSGYEDNDADRIVGEKNFGGAMVHGTIRNVEGGDVVSYKDVSASRGKAVRAEPVVALYERGMVHHVGPFPVLEEELVSWVPDSGMPSPNRLDALVWAITELKNRGQQITQAIAGGKKDRSMSEALGITDQGRPR